MRASRASMGPRSSGEVARQHASARSNQRFVKSFLCSNLFFTERHSYVHICGLTYSASAAYGRRTWEPEPRRRPHQRAVTTKPTPHMSAACAG